MHLGPKAPAAARSGKMKLGSERACEGVCDGKPKSASTTVGRCLMTRETLEHLRALAGRNSWTVVFDCDDDMRGVGDDGDRYLSAIFIVANCIVSKDR
jgi:hypothetical protein